jgi:hypothetical protein
MEQSSARVTEEAVCAGKVLSFSQRKAVEDATGSPVFEMRHKKLTMHNTIIAFPPGRESDVALTAKQEITMVQMYKRCTIRATVHDLLSGRPVQLTLLGDVRGKSGVILLGDESSRHVIAKMYKVRHVQAPQAHVFAVPDKSSWRILHEGWPREALRAVSISTPSPPVCNI